MLYLILGFILLLIFLMIFSKNVFYKYYKQINLKIKKRMDAMLKLTKIAPVIVLLIIFILALTYFKTKLNIRISHAWLVLNFWLCTMIFYYIIAEIGRIRKLVVVLPASGMIISMCVAIYLTPLYHYENIFQNTNLLIPNFFGVIMLITFYYITYKILGKDTKK
jgi:fatty acid desaturase